MVFRVFKVCRKTEIAIFFVRLSASARHHVNDARLWNTKYNYLGGVAQTMEIALVPNVILYVLCRFFNQNKNVQISVSFICGQPRSSQIINVFHFCKHNPRKTISACPIAFYLARYESSLLLGKLFTICMSVRCNKTSDFHLADALADRTV